MCFPTTMRTISPLEIHFLGRTGLIIGLYGVVLHGADARNVQKCVALQNNAKNVQQLTIIVEKSGRANFWESKNETLGIV